jgi:hypothetical protein
MFLLPGRVGCRDYFLYVHAGQTATHLRAKNAIAVMDQVAGRRLEREVAIHGSSAVLAAEL